MKRDLAYYRSLPYRLTVERLEEPEDGLTYYCASYDELPTVKGVHTDQQMARKLAKELFDSYIEAHLEWGREIPEPATSRSPKVGGRFTFRQVSSTIGDSDPAETRVLAGGRPGSSEDSLALGGKDLHIATRRSGSRLRVEV